MPTPTPKPNPKPAAPLQFKGLRDWIEVFRAGTQTDSKGRSHTYTTGDLDQMVANHKPDSAPAVIGHPEETDPAWAWVDEIKRDGDSLFVKFKDIHPDFEAGVDAGRYRNRSVSIYRDGSVGWCLAHVGWLGAQPPAVTGLAPLKYAAPQGEVFEFSAERGAVSALIWAVSSAATLLRGMRDYLIETASLEKADAVLPGYAIESITNSAQEARTALYADPPSSYSLPTGDPDMPDITQEQLDAEVAKARKEAAEVEQAKYAAQGKELADLQDERRKERISTAINGWKAKGKVLPAEEAGLAEFMASLETAPETFTFSQAGKDVKKTPADWFAAFMDARGPVVKLNKPGLDEGSGPDDDQVTDDAEDAAAKASAYVAAQAKLGIKVSASDAVRKFMRKTS